MTTKPKPPKPLRCWSGTLHGVKVICVCAHTRADASRLIAQVDGGSISGIYTQIKDYFSECWGNNMKDITPERGVLVVPFYGATPSRLL